MAFEPEGGYRTHARENPADKDRITPKGNAKRIAELEEVVDALFQTVEGLQQAVGGLQKQVKTPLGGQTGALDGVSSPAGFEVVRSRLPSIPTTIQLIWWIVSKSRTLCRPGELVHIPL